MNESLGLWDDPEAELLQKSVVERRGRVLHRIDAGLRLREGDDLADVLGPREGHDRAIHACRDAAVGRGAELERVEERAETLGRLLLGGPHHLEDPLLDRPLVDTDAPATELAAVDDEVV